MFENTDNADSFRSRYIELMDHARRKGYAPNKRNALKVRDAQSETEFIIKEDYRQLRPLRRMLNSLFKKPEEIIESAVVGVSGGDFSADLIYSHFLGSETRRVISYSESDLALRALMAFSSIDSKGAEMSRVSKEDLQDSHHLTGEDRSAMTCLIRSIQKSDNKIKDLKDGDSLDNGLAGLALGEEYTPMRIKLDSHDHFESSKDPIRGLIDLMNPDGSRHSGVCFNVPVLRWREGRFELLRDNGDPVSLPPDIRRELTERMVKNLSPDLLSKNNEWQSLFESCDEKNIYGMCEEISSKLFSQRIGLDGAIYEYSTSCKEIGNEDIDVPTWSWQDQNKESHSVSVQSMSQFNSSGASTFFKIWYSNQDGSVEISLFDKKSKNGAMFYGNLDQMTRQLLINESFKVLENLSEAI